MWILCVSYVHLMCVLCVSYVYLLCILCVSYVYLLCILCVSCVYLMCILCVSYVYLIDSYCISFLGARYVCILGRDLHWLQPWVVDFSISFATFFILHVFLLSVSDISPSLHIVLLHLSWDITLQSIDIHSPFRKVDNIRPFPSHFPDRKHFLSFNYVCSISWESRCGAIAFSYYSMIGHGSKPMGMNIQEHYVTCYWYYH